MKKIFIVTLWLGLIITFLSFGYLAYSSIETSATSLTDTVSFGSNLVIPLSTWVETDQPAVAVQASASKVLGASGVRHVVTTISACLNNSGGTTNSRFLNLRDGTSGMGTILWNQRLGVSATVGDTKCITLSGLAIIGSAATAMTLEFVSAPNASNFETVSLTGFSVQ